MHFSAHCLKRGGTLSLPCPDDATITAVYGEGGGCTLNVSGAAAAIWLPLLGRLQVTAFGFPSVVRGGEVLITEQETQIKAIGHAHCRWVAMLGRKAAWRRLLAGVTGGLPEAQLQPARHPVGRNLRRKTIALARAADPFLLESAANAVVDDIAVLQRSLYEAIARCPGRTHAKRRQVFLRLQRVRAFIGVHCDQDLDNDVLARMANYSPCHFLRTFNQVFRETPHAYLVTERLERARRLLRSSDLAIAEIALASGFENRSAFSRLFHERYGATAREARRKAAVA